MKESRYKGYLLVDNQGSRFTGQKRLFGGLDVNAPLGIADKLSVSGMVSDGEKLHNVRVSYGLPLNYSGLRLTVAASRTRYALGGSYSALDATGSVSAVEGTIAYPLVRRHDSNIDLSLNIAHRDLHDNLNAVSVFNPRTADVGAATLPAHEIRHGLRTSLLHDDRRYGDCGRNEPAGCDRGREHRHQWRLRETSGESLSGNAALSRSLGRVSTVGQKDLRVKALDSSEQLFISGSGGVRAYAEGMSGDNGYIFNLELPYALPKIRHSNLQHTLLLL